ncbi:sugar phosphate isomerase/epimerase [bacterium]|jgi:sugar phosphate isomerase/epimerase|nr:sugar phosphate isomerase/epimerase [Verrucomicrobiota bacterium]MDA7632758.1 sugar phosphate isomerase/epimerase [bacterium]MDA7645493.1 sugar phosphate isomerase/epimerase [bacterium]MDA7667804.1 sugar phosphate isomerase/epimerase [bacterium]MDB4746359.1 sugar phosphate isomerase/epimerase [Verrucomicrobiota bacterium]
MKLGFVSAILPDLSLSEVLNFTSSEGFSCVELMCWPVGAAERRYAGVTHLDVTELSDSQASDLNAQMADLGIEISGLGYYPNPLTPDPEEAQVAIDQISRIITAAPKLGVKVVNTFIGRDPSKSIEGNWPRFLEVWRPLVKLAEENGVKIAIENCPMYFSNDEWPSGKNLAYCPEVWRRMFHDISSDSFGLNYDPSHFVWQHIQEGPALIEFASKLFHAHAKDARVDQDRLNDVGILGTPLQYHTPKLPGLGNVNWTHFFSILSEQGYAGPVCIEVEDRPYEKTLESRKGALRQSQRFLKQFMAEELG